MREVRRGVSTVFPQASGTFWQGWDSPPYSYANILSAHPPPPPHRIAKLKFIKDFAYV